MSNVEEPINYLLAAKRNLTLSILPSNTEGESQHGAQMAIACALIALVERLDALTNKTALRVDLLE